MPSLGDGVFRAQASVGSVAWLVVRWPKLLRHVKFGEFTWRFGNLKLRHGGCRWHNHSFVLGWKKGSFSGCFTCRICPPRRLYLLSFWGQAILAWTSGKNSWCCKTSAWNWQLGQQLSLGVVSFSYWFVLTSPFLSHYMYPQQFRNRIQTASSRTKWLIL